MSSLSPSGPVHGGDVWGAARRLQRDLHRILDLSASLNPLGPPPGLDQVVSRALDLVCHYPDRSNFELRRALAAGLGLEPGDILIGNGSTSLIRLLSRALELKTILVMAPVFGEFPRSLALAGRHFHYYQLSEKNHFLPTAQDMEAVWAQEPSCLVLTNPQTPCGDLVDPAVLDRCLELARRRRAWVVVDEAFMDFAPREARAWAPRRVREYPRLVVLRSLTKFYCLAGLRLGYLLCQQQGISPLAEQGEPWSVNTLAQAAGVFCLEQEEYARDTRRLVRGWRREMAAELEEMGLEVYPSQVNYLLTRLPAPGPEAARVASACAEQGILLRDCSSFPGCGPRHLRLAVTTPQQRKRLYPVLREALEG